MTTTTEALLTAEEFRLARLPGTSQRRELVRGVVEILCQPGFFHGRTQVRIAVVLEQHARASKLGRVTVETGVVTERDPDTVRGPDVAFWSFARLPADQNPDGYADAVPDLCVEILSPNDRSERVKEKARDYLKAGVQQVWIVDTSAQSVTLWKPGQEHVVLKKSDVLDGGDVLPGFCLPVEELFG